MINEAIVSTGIYYYDEENVTESRLAFRTAVDEPSIGSVEQWDSVGTYSSYPSQVTTILITNALCRLTGNLRSRSGRTALTDTRCNRDESRALYRVPEYVPASSPALRSR